MGERVETVTLAELSEVFDASEQWRGEEDFLERLERAVWKLFTSPETPPQPPVVEIDDGEARRAPETAEGDPGRCMCLLNDPEPDSVDPRCPVHRPTAEGHTAYEASLSYIRASYQVPARRGRPVKVDGREGIIVGGQDGHLLVKLRGEETPVPCHPTWRVQYFTEPPP